MNGGLRLGIGCSGPESFRGMHQHISPLHDLFGVQGEQAIAQMVQLLAPLVLRLAELALQG